MDTLMIHGDGMNLNKLYIVSFIMIVTMTSLFASKDKINKEQAMRIGKVWENIEHYWKEHDKSTKYGNGDSDSKLDELENTLKIELPQEIKMSLIRNYQYSRRGKESVISPWFGTNVGINLLSAKEIEIFYTEYVEGSGLEDTELAHISVVFIGDLEHYSDTSTWHQDWIPIACNEDIPIVIFIDLNEKSKNYQNVIALYSGYFEGIGDHFRFAKIADNYIDFLTELEDEFLKYQDEHNHKMIEEGIGKGFEFVYYEKKLELPKGFWTDEYREEMIKKLGLE